MLRASADSCRNHLPGLMRQFATAAVRRGRQGHVDGDTCDQATVGEDIVQTFAQAEVAVIGRGAARAAVFQVIGQRERLQRLPGLDGRLQQRGVEVQDMAAIGRRALGKHRDVATGAKQRRDLCVDDLRVATAAAAQEDGFALRCQPADDRPGADFMLGDEGRGRKRVDDEDIDPRHVVGHQHAARCDVAAAGLKRHAEDVQQLPRPALTQAQTCGVAAERIDQCDREHAAGQMQSHAQTAPATQQRWAGGVAGWGARCAGDIGVQSLRPRKCLAYLSETLSIGISSGRSAVLKSGSHAGSPHTHAPARR